MRRLLFIFCLVLCVHSYAEDSIATVAPDTLNTDKLMTDTLITDVMPNVQVFQSESVEKLLREKATGVTTQLVEVAGYRVQIYSSNHQQLAKREAIRLEKDMQSKIDLPIYVSYVPPFWKVRIGDFATYVEAQEFKNNFVHQFPELMGDTYVVRDQVTIRQ
ncbi:MAG: SPOR domain-containing protein [Paludibacteraceae bacterium]|nr:SPOR domain-containing protein [Paludibacteraceae bacterium]